jgi:hypothetical protein
MMIQDMGHIYHRRWEQQYESSVHRWESSVPSGRLSFVADVPDTTELNFEIRAAAREDRLTRTAWQAVNDRSFSLRDSDRCLQYRVTFKSGNGDLYPILDRVEINLSTQP